MRLRLPSPPSVKYRPNAELRDQDHGPGMVLRPASPSSPDGGYVKAAGLKYPLPSMTGRPVASARPLPTTPVPAAFDWFPRICAVSGVPLSSSADPLSVQLRFHQLACAGVLKT